MGARFVRLGIAGFKSFADAAAIEILPGLTGIVGPNGCGKSNVAEALRWVMGEANARTLRGGEMDDVIFAGTGARPSRNLAEVSVTIEDDERGLPPPFTGQAEVQVVRRIERGAGSVYRVNGREARARDVQTLFADVASGARSSAMVSQGRVGTLVNANPEERRGVLEEAAGITGLHARRSEAETRLRATEANLARAEERRALLEHQLAGLQAQAQQAARYRTVMTAALEAEANLLAVGRGRAQLARDTAGRALEDAGAALAQAGRAAAAATADAERCVASLPGLRDAAAVARTAFERERVAQEGIAAEAARARAALAAAEQRRTQLASDLEHALAAVREADGADARLVAEAERLRGESAGHPAALEAAQHEAGLATTVLREADQAAAHAAAAATEATAQAAAMQRLLQGAEDRARRAREMHARLAAERSGAAAQAVDPARLEAAEAALVAADAALADARRALEQADAAHVKAVAAAGKARDRHATLDAQRHKLAVAVSALAEVLAVKDGERWPPVIDRLVVPSGLEAALGAALGEELAAAADPSRPRHWRLLPAVAAAALPGPGLAETVRGPDVIGRALAHIGLVQSEAEGDAAQPGLLPGQSLVSRDGAVWRWDGYTVRAGTPTAAAVRLQQRNRLRSLQAELDGITAECDAGRAARDAANTAERTATAAEQQARTARREAEVAADRARGAALSLRHQADTAGVRLRALDEQLAQAQPEFDAAGAAVEAVRADHAAQPDPASLRRDADATRAAVTTARGRDAAANRAVDALLAAEQQRQARLGTIGRERDDRRLRARDAASRVTDLQARLDEAAGEHDRLAAMPGRAAQDGAAATARVEAAGVAQRAATAALGAAEAAAAAALSRARATEGTVYAAREERVRAEGAVEHAEQGWAAALDRVAEREAALPPLPAPTEITAAAEDRARSRLQRLLAERDGIGPVNLRAEIEAEAIATDVETSGRESEELATAIAKLRGSIGHLNREGRERLTAVFQQVDRHFQALFTRMFGGGRAHLALVGSDDPLQAGLEIYAQPPGKKLSALSLLSGGEQALTALSLIFAVFRCNPAPLCVLDEVDAPLDDANVGRFCALLADMVRETATRFLVVTHHQLTMAAMDRLYGVTMQERGVSHLLSVDLSRAVDMIEAVAAE